MSWVRRALSAAVALAVLSGGQASAEEEVAVEPTPVTPILSHPAVRLGARLLVQTEPGIYGEFSGAYRFGLLAIIGSLTLGASDNYRGDDGPGDATLIGGTLGLALSFEYFELGFLAGGKRTQLFQNACPIEHVPCDSSIGYSVFPLRVGALDGLHLSAGVLLFRSSAENWEWLFAHLAVNVPVHPRWQLFGRVTLLLETLEAGVRHALDAGPNSTLFLVGAGGVQLRPFGPWAPTASIGVEWRR